MGSPSAEAAVRGITFGTLEEMRSPLESIPGFWWVWSLMPFDSTECTVVMSMLPAMQLIMKLLIEVLETKVKWGDLEKFNVGGFKYRKLWVKLSNMKLVKTEKNDLRLGEN